MVVIRLARFGNKHRPRYRVTVADSRRSATAKYIDVLGFYNPEPRGQEEGLRIDMEKVQSWISKGAQPTQRVKSLLKKAEASK